MRTRSSRTRPILFFENGHQILTAGSRVSCLPHMGNSSTGSKLLVSYYEKVRYQRLLQTYRRLVA